MLSVRTQLLGQQDGLFVLRSLGGSDLDKPISRSTSTTSSIDDAVPDTFTFNGRVQQKCRLRRRGISKVDAVTVRIAGKSQFQADRFLPRRALNGMLAAGARCARSSQARPTVSRADPPSRASEATTVLRAASASRRRARYRLDLPVPLAPVTRFKRSKRQARDSAEIDIPRSRASGSLS